MSASDLVVRLLKDSEAKAMSAPSNPSLPALRGAPESSSQNAVPTQAIGTKASQSQTMARTPSGASGTSSPSSASRHHQQGDYAAMYTSMPSHGFVASRLHYQSSFNTGASQSPAGSEAHEQLAYHPTRSAGQYDASTSRPAGVHDTSSRRSHLSRANRSLKHKDSFGGSYGHNMGADMSAESADEASTSTFVDYSQRHANPELDDRSIDSHHRTVSLSHPAQQPQNATDLYSSEPVEVLGRPSAFTDLATSQTHTFRSPSLSTSRSRTALSAAANAASHSDKMESIVDPSDITFASRFDQSLALNVYEDEPSSTTFSAPVHRPQVPPEQDALHLPESAAAKSSPAPASTSAPNSKASDHILEVSVTPSASQRQPDVKAAPHKDMPVPAQSRPPQEQIQREKNERENVASTSRRPPSSRAREGATSSASNRVDPTGTSARSLKSSHRTLPQLPSAKNVRPAPPPAMYWSKAPVHGSVPRRSFRAHTANLCDEVMWLFGGCDHRGCFRDLWCFDTETMCWSKPKVTGDIPPARRAHSATMVNKRLFVFAGGDGPHYFNDLYIFDTVSLRWSKPEVAGTAPSPRRAHTCNYYEGQLIVFGGGNGVGALNDVHTLDVTDLSRLEWRRMECSGKLPIGRGYHTSNLVDGKLIVIGGSDGHMSFNDIHILRLDTQTWYQVKTDEIYNRLGHTATQVGSYLFIFGGHDSKTYTSELLTLNLVNLQWEPRKVCGKKPLGRGYHQAWLRDSRLFVHGGFDGKDIFDDLHYLDLAACAYLPQITSFSVELDDEE